MDTATLSVDARAREFRARLARRELSERTRMAREWRAIRSELTREIDGLLQAIGTSRPDADQLQALDRYLLFRDQATERIAAYADNANTRTVQLVSWASTFGEETAAQLLEGGAAATGVRMTRMNPQAVEALAGRVRYGRAAHAFRTIPARGVEATERALIDGVALGRNPNVTAESMAEALDMSVYNAQRIARTETMTAYRAAHTSTYAINRAMLHGWKWQAALDDRTCAVCWAMDGVMFDAAAPFETHVNCRCTPVPVPRGYEAVMAARPPGSEAFGRLPTAAQRRILGPGRHALYRDGTPLSAMVERSTDPYWGASRGLRPLREMPGRV